MKIIITSLDDSDKILVGGKHVHQQLLRKGLIELGHEIINVFPKKSIFYYLVRIWMLGLTKLKIFKRPTVFNWTLNYLKKTLVHDLAKYRSVADAVFAQDPVAACAAAEVFTGIPIVMTLHGYLGRESVNYGGYNERDAIHVLELAKVFERDALKSATRVITVDSKIAHYLKDDFNYLPQTTLLKNAIDPSLFSKFSPEDIQQFKRQLQAVESKKIVLIPRRLVRKNGVDIAIEAARYLKNKNYNDFLFLVIGDGPERKSLERAKAEAGLTDQEFLFKGSIDHKSSSIYYASADIVLVPSVIRDGVEEAVSLSMLEGMAAQKIVVVSNIGGMKEVIENQKNGFVFEQANYEELANVLISLNQESVEKIELIKKTALKLILEKHHYKAHTKIYLEQIQQDKEK